MNSPAVCQYYIAKAREPMRKWFPNFVVHYMDAILFSAPSILETQHMFDKLNYRDTVEETKIKTMPMEKKCKNAK